MDNNYKRYRYGFPTILTFLYTTLAHLEILPRSHGIGSGRLRFESYKVNFESMLEISLFWIGLFLLVSFFIREQQIEEKNYSNDRQND